MTLSKKVFEKIYRDRQWGDDGRGSGRGSTTENAAQTCRVLHDVLDKFRLHSLLDAPCGALDWTEAFIRERITKDPEFKYCGVDVAASVIEGVRRRVSIDNCTCEVVDLATDTPPRGYDLILCRDTLQHLDYQHIAGVLRGFVKSDAPYLLLSSYRDEEKAITTPNRDIEMGSTFSINLLQDPFNFTDGVLRIYDDIRPTGSLSGQTLILYDSTTLARSDAFVNFVSRN